MYNNSTTELDLLGEVVFEKKYCLSAKEYGIEFAN